MNFEQYHHNRIRRNNNDIIKFNNTINFEIDKRARYKSCYITVVNNKNTNLQICCYFFRTHDINVD